MSRCSDFFLTDELAEDKEFFTFDIEALYPSLICKDDAMSVQTVVGHDVLNYYAAPGRFLYADFLIKLLRLLLLHPVISICLEGDVCFFQQQVGLTTGLSCASTIANIFLSKGFDFHLDSRLPIRKYVRYIDDGGGIVKQGNRSRILRHLNSWHPMIVVQDKDLACGLDVHLLDVRLRSTGGRIYCATYRKDQNIYDYLPASSAHHPATQVSILTSEFSDCS